ncbi:predicted protein [Botrytis cinerea T4]|uniref:Uncharacterized protein n=1 Tax=Botryotinia fuckeliana (strain T4) TaxID=999810 RepID=G2XSC8_BOTF4|nr:predicted protein [Botrytis cinerea T4]
METYNSTRGVRGPSLPPRYPTAHGKGQCNLPNTYIDG